MRKQKGFTMVELLATIVILGLLTTVVGIGVFKTIQGSEREYYENQEEMMRAAAMEYYSDHRSELPAEIGEESFVLLSTLVDQNYIDEIVDRQEESCVDYEGNVSYSGTVYNYSAVVVTKVSAKDYLYYPLLICPNYTSNTDDGDGGSLDCSVVNFTVDPNYDSDTWYNHNITIGVSNVPEEVTSYRIHDCSSEGSCVTTYGSGKPTEFVLSEEGNRYGKLTLFDSHGNTCETSNTASYHIDKTPPTKPAITIQAGEDDLILTIASSDALSGIDHWDYSMDGETWQTYSEQKGVESTEITFAEDMDQLVYFRTCDVAGNCSENSSVVLTLDLSLPVPMIQNPTNGNWTNQSFSLQVSTTYTGQIAYWQYSYDASSYTTYSNSASSSFTTTPFSAERNQAAYIRYCNIDGRCSDPATTMIRIDKTPPTLSFVYPEGTYVIDTMYNQIDGHDANGISKIQVQINKNGAYDRTLTSDTSSLSYSLNATANYTVYVQVFDQAGNKQVQMPDNGLGWYYANFTVTKKAATVLQSNYTICPNDQMIPTRDRCLNSNFWWNTLFITNVRTSGTTVTMHIRVHMNDIESSWNGLGQHVRTLCVANASNQCVITLGTFNIGRTPTEVAPGTDFYNQDFSFDISGLPAGDYRIIVDGASEEFRFRDTPYMVNIFRVTG